MKATDLALFFDNMRRQDITFDVNKLNGTTFKDFFGADGDRTANVEREGVFLTVYVEKDSMCEDFFKESMEEYLKHCVAWLYNSPYNKGNNELMYIIEIEDEQK